MTSYNPEDWTKSDWVEREFDDYELTEIERTNIAAIKQNIEQNAYTSAKDCSIHMELLEKHANNLKSVLDNEHSLNKANWNVEKAYKEILLIYKDLEKIHKRLRSE